MLRLLSFVEEVFFVSLESSLVLLIENDPHLLCSGSRDNFIQVNSMTYYYKGQKGARFLQQSKFIAATLVSRQRRLKEKG